jgi:RNA-binding protein YlmH
MDVKSFDSLFARLDDLRECAVRGNLGISAFFSPREALAAAEYLERCRASFISFGGYSDAERKKIYILPDFIEDAESVESILEYGFSLDIDCILISGSRFESFSHRDVMGSILALGVERDVIGDIVMLDNSRAVFFCESKLTPFFEGSIERIGRDKVSARRIEFDEAVLPERKVQKINDTVASARLDCVVAALCSFSRERAKEAIVSSLVELNYECEERVDREISTPAVVSVRGVGKFNVISLSDKTKKGRYRLLAEKLL